MARTDILVWGLRGLLVAAVLAAVLWWWHGRRQRHVGGRRALAFAAAGLALLVAANVVVPLVADARKRERADARARVAASKAAARAAGSAVAGPGPASWAAPSATATTDPSAAPVRDTARRDVPSDPAVSGPSGRLATTPHLTPTTVGGYEDVTVPGPRSGYTGTVTVWLPPSYASAASAHATYPVLEAFHGIKPNPYAYFDLVHLDSVTTTLAAQHRLRQPIVVIPHWAPDGVDDECTDIPGGVRMETWLTQDVPEWIHAHYRTASGRDSWSAFGMSAGGWCANLAATLHPGTFATAVAFGGYWRPDWEPTFTGFPADSPSGRRYDLVSSVAANPPPIAVWALASKGDDTAYPTTSQVVARARAPMSVTSVLLPGGRHSTTLWLPYVTPALTWLASASPGFAPAR